MAPDPAARTKELRALLDDLQSKLVRGDLEESAYLELKSRAREELDALDEEMLRERAESELRTWKKVAGALLLAAGAVLFLASARVLASGTPVSEPSPESSALVFLQWLSLAPMVVGALLLLREPRREEEVFEACWTFPAGPAEVRRALRSTLERRSGRVEERDGWLECGLGRRGSGGRLALYLSGTPTRSEVRVKARLGAGTILREIREEAGAALRR